MIVKNGFIAEGTTCSSCEEIIKRQVMKVDGVRSVTFDYSKESGYVTFDDQKTNIDEILYKIEEKNYLCFIMKETETNNVPKILGWSLAIIGIVIAGYFLFGFIEGINMPAISQNMSYALLLGVGLLTGFHCISMCGGFVISYTTKDIEAGIKPHRSHLLYGTGKLLSYTLIGAIFGLIGSIIAFTPLIRGIAGFIAGIFLILFGLKMLNIFPILRKISIKPPRFMQNIIGKRSNSSPLMIGLLNGLMIACGPLQAIYVMAAGTGSMIEGAKLLFIFGAGTLPAMLGFGYFASIISKKATHKLLKASGALVILLGLLMINNGLVLTGTGYDFNSVIGMATATGVQDTADGIVIDDGYQVINMNVTRYGWEPDTFVLKEGVPVRWIIEGQEITGCNNAIQVPAYDLEFDIKSGKQTIEFTPDEAGVIRWSCWMGMIPGTFVVKDNIDLSDAKAIKEEIQNAPKPQASGSCGGSCGSPTCGATTGGSCGCGG